MAKQDIKCPHCGDILEVNSDWLGMTLNCPHCKKMFVFGDEDHDIQLKKISRKNDQAGKGGKPKEWIPPAQNNSTVETTVGGMFTPLRKYACFSGRATRREYWLFSIFVSLVTAFLQISHAAVTLLLPQYSVFLTLFITVIGLFLFLPSLAAMVRRCHDADRPGWRILIALIPFIGWLLLLYTLCHRSVGDNRYGPNPNAMRKDEVWPVLLGILLPLLILGGLFAGIATYFPIVEKQHEMVNRLICINHLNRIHTALELYSRDQEGQYYPPARGEDGLQLIRDMHPEDDNLFICPADITRHYCYVGCRLSPGQRAFPIPTVICFAHPEKRAVVLMADGTVQSFIMDKCTKSCTKLVKLIIEKGDFTDPKAQEACKKVLRNAKRFDHKQKQREKSAAAPENKESGN